jgi:sterol desaturase/sphingolipid hydroxylase (fatty acid hydroxylase superfamily)
MIHPGGKLMAMDLLMVEQVILLVLILATVMGIVQSANVIFEADTYFKKEKLPEAEVQITKKQKIMPKLWAPMFEGIIGELFLALFLIPGILDIDAWLMVSIMVIFFLVIIIGLTRFFYYSGRRALHE